MTSPSVQAADDRYEIRIGGDLAGFTEFVDRGEQRIFYHTEIDEAFNGQGLSTILIGQALTDTRRVGMRIVPVCRAVAAYLKRHREFADITDPVTGTTSRPGSTRGSENG